MDVAKLFYNGRSQAVRLPKEYRFDSSEVYIKKIGSAVILMPREKAWEVHDAGVAYFSEDYMDKREQPKAERRNDI